MLSWSLTAAETERLWGTPGSRPTPRECLYAPLGASRSQGRAKQGCSCSLLLLLLLLGWVGGLPAQWGIPAVAPASGSGARLKGHIQIGDGPGLVPGRGPGQLLGYLGHRAAGTGAPSPALCPVRRGARAQGELSQGAGLPALAPTGLFLFSAHDLLFLLGRSWVGDIQESPWDEFPSEEVWHLAPLITAGAPSPLGHPSPSTAQCKPATLQPGSAYSGLDPCSQLGGQMHGEGTGTKTGRTYKEKLLQHPLPPTSHFVRISPGL